MADLRVIIVGGGIAGLASAVALRGPNREIIVLEASRMNREIGALISLQPNASKIATALGLDKFLADKGPMVDEAFRIYNMDGVLQTEIPSNSKRFGADRIIYYRVDLHDALKQAAISQDGLGQPATIIPSSRVTDCDCEQGIVTLENGETFKGDIIIGADGIHSILRPIVAGAGASKPKPTGISAYRILLDTADLEDCSDFNAVVNPREPVTTMVFGHDKRIIMGPGRKETKFGVVALVPDDKMNESSNTDSWTSEGSIEKLLQSYEAFPAWIKELFKASREAPALYQLRDIDPLTTWVRGRVILIGDAAHAMLPTQGQGASQSFEDAEALQAFLADLAVPHTSAQVERCLQDVFETRHERASLIQAYSRQQGKPATDKESKKVNLNPAEFVNYNCQYSGARDWRQMQMSLEREPAIEATARPAAISV